MKCSSLNKQEKEAMTPELDAEARIRQFVPPILVILISIPTTFGWIPMNGFYGIRVREAFASNANWYAINRLGSMAIIGACFVWIVAAAYAPVRLAKWIGVAAIVLTLLGLTIMEGWTL